MRLKARLLPLDDDCLDILSQSLPAGGLKPSSGRYPLAVHDRVFPSILAKGDSFSGFWVSAEAVFTKKELQGISHFECVCRKYIPESPEDYERNAASFGSADPRGRNPVRLGSGFVLSRIRLKPHMVGAIGDWTQEYVIGSAVAQVFETARFSGWSRKPVLNPGTDAPYTEFFQLFSDVVMKPGNIDSSVERVQGQCPEANDSRRHLGCLSYAAEGLSDLPDFARTAEPWAGWQGLPSWVVSSRVAGVFKDRKLKGWSFRPVLTVESDLYRQYLEQWEILRDEVTKSRTSVFDGGRW